MALGKKKVMPPANEIDLDDLFTYHPPQPNQINRYNNLRSAAKEFAFIMLDSCPDSADRTTALRKLRECVMIANAAIALEK